MEKIPDGVAIFLGAATPHGDVEFRQGYDFFYFTGVEIPDAFLVVDGLRKESILFFTMSEAAADGEAIPLDLIRAPAAYTGIERVLLADQFSAQLASLGNRGRPLYTMFKPEELGRENSKEKFNALQKSMTLSPLDGRLTRELQFVRQLRERFPQADVRDSDPLVWDLRKLKSPGELAIMRQAARVGVQAHNALIASTRPGVVGDDPRCGGPIRDIRHRGRHHSRTRSRPSRDDGRTMLIGNRHEISPSMLAPGYTLASVIANEFAEPATGEMHVSALMACGAVLLGVTLVVNVIARWLVWRVARQGKA